MENMRFLLKDHPGGGTRRTLPEHGETGGHLQDVLENMRSVLQDVLEGQHGERGEHGVVRTWENNEGSRGIR